MKKKKKIDAKLKLEKRIYKTFVFITIFLIFHFQELYTVKPL